MKHCTENFDPDIIYEVSHNNTPEYSIIKSLHSEAVNCVRFHDYTRAQEILNELKKIDTNSTEVRNLSKKLNKIRCDVQII
jgi:Zn-finger protein